ncbi:MAG: hypothetical protein ACO1SX_11285 [Actinomycetota bacterium]
MAAFIKSDPAKAASLVADMQKLTDQFKSKRLKTFVVFTGGPELKDAIEKVGAEKKVDLPLTFLPQGTSAEDFQSYKLNPQAQNTILVYSRGRVRSNLVDVDEKSFPEVIKATEQMLAR